MAFVNVVRRPWSKYWQCVIMFDVKCEWKGFSWHIMINEQTKDIFKWILFFLLLIQTEEYLFLSIWFTFSSSIIFFLLVFLSNKWFIENHLISLFLYQFKTNRLSFFTKKKKNDWKIFDRIFVVKFVQFQNTTASLQWVLNAFSLKVSGT